MIEFELDHRKAAANVRKHGIQFTDAVMVLEDKSVRMKKGLFFSGHVGCSELGGS